MAADLLVTPDGPGLAAAVEQSRRLPAGQPKRILLADGVHRVESCVNLTAADEGLTVEAAPGAHPVLRGGRRITGWTAIGDGLWAAPVASDTWDFRMLVVNGRRADRARLPAEGRFQHLDTWTVPWMSTTGGGWKVKPTPEQLTHLTCRPEDLGSWLERRNAEVTVYHQWDESVVGVAEVNAAQHQLVLATPLGHPPGAFGVKDYVVWNVREGLTRPGQWYLDRAARRVVYWPLEGEDPAKLEIEAPTTETILAIRGTPEQPVRHVTVRGLRFELTNTPLVAGGFGAAKFAGALETSRSSGVTFEDVVIERVNGQGFKSWQAADLTIRRCTIADAGACAMQLSGGHGEVSDCLIHHVGRSYPSAIAVKAGGRDGSWRLVHNEIHDVPYSGLSVGGDDHVIEGNLIHRVMQELHDGGGIYITFCKRVRVAGNWLHDIAPEGRSQTNAYYLDEQAEDCVVEGNLSEDAATPLLCHMTRNNTFRGNVFINRGTMDINLIKSEGIRFAGNRLVAGGRILFRNPQGLAGFDGDVLHSAEGRCEGLLADPGPTVSHQDPGLTVTAGRVVNQAGEVVLDVAAAGPRERQP